MGCLARRTVAIVDATGYEQLSMRDPLIDPRAYLQQRVKLFTGVSFVFFTCLLGLDFATPAPGEPLLGTTRLASLAVLVSNAAVWAYTRQGKRPAWACRLLELVSMGTAMAVFASLPLFPPIEGAGGAMALTTPTLMAVVTLLRAAIIPSPWWLSVAVGVIWGSVMTASATIGWEGVVLTLPGLPDFEQRRLPLAIGVIATLAFSFVAGVTSHVIYGLETKVRAAMELGQYTLESKIGEGGMGVVYRARHRMLRRPTAVKLLPPDKAGERAIARFEHEVQQTSRLTHPNTVAIFDFGRTEDGVFFYAMEYLDGVSLEDLVQLGGPLPPDRAVHLLVQACEALSEAHGMGLVHRDIKPDNIMVCERGGVADVVKVLDFGLVKDIEAPRDEKLSATHTIHGTPLYMAPESLTDPDSVDARTDLYALGAVAYFLLAGQPVFSGNLVQVLGHHLHTKPERLTERGAKCAPEFEAVVQRCLEKDPDARFQSAAELRSALLACAGGTWTQAAARAWWESERAPLKARRERAQVPAHITVARASLPTTR